MRKINVIDHVQIENVKIDYVNEVKNLGIVFDSHLSWESQAKCVYQKVNFSLHSLIDQNRFLDFETKVKLVKSLVLPIITYGDLLFSMASKEALERLNKSYNACIRFIFNLKKYDHISTYRSLLFGMPLEQYFEQRLLKFIYNCLLGDCPDYFRNYFNISLSRRRCDMYIPRSRLSIGRSAFKIFGAVLWNTLPPAIKNMPLNARNRNLFEKEINKFFINNTV